MRGLDSTWDLLSGRGEEAEGPQPVVDGHHDDVLVHPDVWPVLLVGVGPHHQGPAVDPVHHRGLLLALKKLLCNNQSDLRIT